MQEAAEHVPYQVMAHLIQTPILSIHRYKVNYDQHSFSLSKGSVKNVLEFFAKDGLVHYEVMLPG
jgi:hypothetical protein